MHEKGDMSLIRIKVSLEVEIDGEDEAENAETRRRFEMAVAGWRELLEASLAQHLDRCGLKYDFGDSDEGEDWRG